MTLDYFPSEFDEGYGIFDLVEVPGGLYEPVIEAIHMLGVGGPR